MDGWRSVLLEHMYLLKGSLHGFSREMLQNTDDTAECKFTKPETAFFNTLTPPTPQKKLQIKSFNKNNYSISAFLLSIILQRMLWELFL